MVLALALVGCFGSVSPALAQGFNVDLDTGDGPPSSGFGGAAGQPGFWNSVDGTPGPHQLHNLLDVPTPASLGITFDPLGGGGLSFNSGNTGDYALLMNDAQQVGNIDSGGWILYTFTGLIPGPYTVYTYAVAPHGIFVPVPVFVPGSTNPNTQIVTGPMPTNNTFSYLITHAVHDVLVGTDGVLKVDITIEGGLQWGAYINGFQIVPGPVKNAPVCTDFDDSPPTTQQWIASTATAVNSANQSVVPDPGPTGHYLVVTDQSGGPSVCWNPTTYSGNWNQLLQGSCPRLEYDVKLFDDGDNNQQVAMPTPNIYIGNGTSPPNPVTTAAFTPSLTVTEQLGNTGWVHVVAPLNLNTPPLTPLGTWTVTGMDSWATLLTNVTYIQLRVELGPFSEVWGYDNICLVDANCCEPLPSGFGCEKVICPDERERCIPTVVSYDPCTEEFTTQECACTIPNRCHLVPRRALFGQPPGPPTCVGSCPQLQLCTLHTNDSNGDGIFEYSCGCGPPTDNVGDVDHDGDVDLIDYALLQNAFTGPRE